MIVVHYPTKNPVIDAPIVKYGTAFSQQQQRSGPFLSPKEVLRATKLKITNAEFARRQEIVAEAAKNCQFVVGDKVVPKSDEGFKKYGECEVTAICKDYLDYGDEWPKNDHPLVVHFKTTEGQEAFATTNYFKDKCSC